MNAPLLILLQDSDLALGESWLRLLRDAGRFDVITATSAELASAPVIAMLRARDPGSVVVLVPPRTGAPAWRAASEQLGEVLGTFDGWLHVVREGDDADLAPPGFRPVRVPILAEVAPARLAPWLLTCIDLVLEVSRHQLWLTQYMGDFTSEMVRAQQLLQEKQAALQESRVDPLTGLLNRRGLGESLVKHFRAVRAVPGEGPLSLLMMDIDHFKRVNDEHGHFSGDLVLNALGQFLRSPFGFHRGSDLVARFGGEEFVVVLPRTSGEAARAAAERVAQDLARVSFAVQGGKQLSPTLSVGVAEVEPGDSTWEDTVARADVALYYAKAAGRNRVVAWGDVPPEHRGGRVAPHASP